MAKWALEFPTNDKYSRETVRDKIDFGPRGREQDEEDRYEIWTTPSPPLMEWPPDPFRYAEISKARGAQKKPRKNKRG